MIVNYDAKTDTLTVVFGDVPVAESDEDKPGVRRRLVEYSALLLRHRPRGTAR